MEVAVPAESQPYVWLRPDRPRRGPQPPLTREQIATTAIRLADADGVHGVTMRRVAAELGCGTMSLYRHVRSKDELLDVMIDAVAGAEAPAPPGTASPSTGPSGDWRADVATMARAMRNAFLRHPWLVQVTPRRPLLGPNVLAQIDFLLSAVDGLGLGIDEMVSVIRTVDSFVRGHAQTELAEQQWRRPWAELDDAEWHREALPYVQHIVESGRYPYFTRMIAEADDFPDPDATFEWQLQRVLDGLAHAIAAPMTGEERAEG
jgi:AcrR family transcriptional regulator